MSSMILVARTGELPPSKRKIIQACRAKCPHGHPCECDGRIPHLLHICKHEGCGCHSRERYDKESK